jgi:hypothetical protein
MCRTLRERSAQGQAKKLAARLLENYPALLCSSERGKQLKKERLLLIRFRGGISLKANFSGELGDL